MKVFLSVISATALLLAVAYGQTSSSSTTTTSATGTGETQSTTTTTENYGTVTEFSPGASLVLSTGTGDPVHYKFSKTVTYVTPDGQVIEASKVKKNSKVRVHYVKDGGDMMVDKVIVTDHD
ncbi:MAG: hypothetical protein QOI34_182 [Verrucomicrobiota bacterium]